MFFNASVKEPDFPVVWYLAVFFQQPQSIDLKDEKTWKKLSSQTHNVLARVFFNDAAYLFQKVPDANVAFEVVLNAEQQEILKLLPTFDGAIYQAAFGIPKEHVRQLVQKEGEIHENPYYDEALNHLLLLKEGESLQNDGP